MFSCAAHHPIKFKYLFIFKFYLIKFCVVVFPSIDLFDFIFFFSNVFPVSLFRWFYNKWMATIGNGLIFYDDQKVNTTFYICFSNCIQTFNLNSWLKITQCRAQANTVFFPLKNLFFRSKSNRVFFFHKTFSVLAIRIYEITDIRVAACGIVSLCKF